MKRPDGAALWGGLVLCALMLAAAHRAGAFPWSIDMFRGESVQALAQSPRVMPPGTLPIDGEAPMSREVAAATLHNPLKPSAGALAAGKTLFGDNCTACHGVSGRGDGTVSFLLRIPPADLTAGVPTQRSDGYIYATIRNGSIVMPSYADAMSSNERWEVVLYLRSLQKKVSAK
ncbi:MAG TPA: c-type cytochrome [Candidatus Binataceae bacterium]|nr:c-type cytochrome [Candidatus Binataceae bacterium]